MSAGAASRQTPPPGSRRRLQVGSDTFEVVFKAQRDRFIEACIDGHTLHLDRVEGHVLVDGRSVDVTSERDERGRVRAVWVRGVRVAVRVRQAGIHAGGSQRSQDGRVLSPMNGQVVKVLRQPGETVVQGECIVVLEAMKMENEVRSPVGGPLTRMDVQPGQTVRPGDALFTVETAEAAPPTT